MVWAQNGKLSGKILDKKTKEPVSFAIVRVSSGGATKGVSTADIKGYYNISPLTPGKYDVEVQFTGYSKRLIKDVTVNFETTTRLDIELQASDLVTSTVEVTEYKVPLIKKDETSTGRKLTSDDIAKMPTRSINAIINTVPGVVSTDAGQELNVRGNRGGDNAYYVNGVRVFGRSALPPPEAVAEVAVITGGVPAQYGDALGGIFALTTKTAPQKYFGNVQMETSRPFDQWRYDLLGISGGGPILRTKGVEDEMGVMRNRRTILGFFSVFQYQGNRDADPSPYGYYKISDRALENMRRSPAVQIQNRFYSRANFYTIDSLEKVKYIQNGGRHQFQTNLSFDYQPSEDILITVGTNVTYFTQRLGANFNLFNSGNNAQATQYDVNGFLRFRQSFNSGREAESKSIIKNIYYQIQLDFTRNGQRQFDPTHRDKLSRYNYVGQFKDNRVDDTSFIGTGGFPVRFRNVDPITGVSDTMTIRTNRPVITKSAFRDWTFSPVPGINTDLANYNQYIYNLNPVVTVNNLPGSLSAFPSNFLIGNGFLFNSIGMGLNGFGSPDVGYAYSANAGAGGLFDALGNTRAGYNFSNQEQYRISAQAGLDIGRHSLKFGFEYEQRIFSSYSATTNLYGRGRSLANRQILSDGAGFVVDTFSTTDVNGTSFLNISLRNRLNTDQNGNILGQTGFDRNLRAALGMPTNTGQFINVDAVHPDQINLGLFTVSDLFNNGLSPMAFWSGYNAYGKRNTTRVGFNDFFTDTINRPIDAFRPIYLAGFIEDKFEIDDLIIRLGLRIDRFDQNIQVLRDPYSLTRLRTAGETNFSNFSGSPSRPSNIGDDYAVYVNRSSQTFNGSNQNQFTITGYRSGNQWFRADGSPTQNPREIETVSGGQVQPWYDVTQIQNDPVLGRLQRDNFITLDAFQSFKPQVNLLPRIAFSFPISEDALFFAHYDILTQRPLTSAGGNPFGNPLQYYAMSQSGNYLQTTLGSQIVNPNLNPQRKIDYQLGFQQRLSQASALKFSLFYSEIRDLIAIRRITSAYPVTYITDGNQDFGVVKGATIFYEMRRNENLTMDASYTLQFAETSASNFAGALLNTATPNLRTTVPANFDNRHTLKLNFDYHLLAGQGPSLFGYKIFENAGVNFINQAISGQPYTRLLPNFTGDVVTGNINGSRRPWNVKTDVRVDKNFFFGGKEGKAPSVLNVYLYVQNLFDVRNVLGVYARSGSATDDGYLASQVGRQDQANVARSGLNAETFAMYYNLLIMNPENVALPRWIRVGCSYNF